MDLTQRIFVERTLAIVKPDIFDKATEIEDVIVRSGFTILQKRKMQLSPEQCNDFYAHHYEKGFFPSLAAYMSSGPIVVLMLARENAIAHWKSIVGPADITDAKEMEPQCLRAQYATSDLKNALHASESFHAAVNEIEFMFPNSVIEPFFSSRETTKEYLSRCIIPTLQSGLIQLCREKPLNPCIWLADWLIQNDPNEPEIRCEVTAQDKERKKGNQSEFAHSMIF